MKHLKNYFIAGLIAILPLWITYFIMVALFNLMASFARPLIKNIPYLEATPLLLNIVSFISAVLIVVFLGMILTNMVGRRAFLIVERLFERIPVLSWIYTSIRKLTEIFYSDEAESRFKRVVLIQYPRPGVYAIGFLTSDVVSSISKKTGKALVNIFLPTTPNPTSGFLLMVPKEDIQILDLTTEDAIKLIVSAGISVPEEA